MSLECVLYDTLFHSHLSSPKLATHRAVECVVISIFTVFECQSTRESDGKKYKYNYAIYLQLDEQAAAAAAAAVKTQYDERILFLREKKNNNNILCFFL